MSFAPGEVKTSTVLLDLCLPPVFLPLPLNGQRKPSLVAT